MNRNSVEYTYIIIYEEKFSEILENIFETINKYVIMSPVDKI